MVARGSGTGAGTESAGALAGAAGSLAWDGSGAGGASGSAAALGASRRSGSLRTPSLGAVRGWSETTRCSTSDLDLKPARARRSAAFEARRGGPPGLVLAADVARKRETSRPRGKRAVHAQLGRPLGVGLDVFVPERTRRDQ